MPEHPRPDTPESKVEHQADQPGVTTGRQSKQAHHGTGKLAEDQVGEQPNAASRD